MSEPHAWHPQNATANIGVQPDIHVPGVAMIRAMASCDSYVSA